MKLTQINKAVYKKVEFANISPTSLEAKISDYFVEGFDEDIKAITYRKAEFRKNNQGTSKQ